MIGSPAKPGRPDAKKELSRGRKWVRRILRTLFVLVVLFGAFLVWVWTTCFAEPPELEEANPAVHALELVTGEDGTVHLGSCWFLERPGRSLLYLEGDPYSIGYSNGRLTSHLMAVQERSLIDTVREEFSSPVSFFAVTVAVLVNNRSLPSYVPLEYQREIFGLACGSEDPLPDMGPRYHRLLNYHAAHDISHWVMDTPLVGCTAFAARRSASADGHLIIARCFDFEAGPHFDASKTITVEAIEPRGQAYTRRRLQR